MARMINGSSIASHTAQSFTEHYIKPHRVMPAVNLMKLNRRWLELGVPEGVISLHIQNYMRARTPKVPRKRKPGYQGYQGEDNDDTDE